jgi:glyoxylase-like metal-dependent hydrolase (beta-lactamase superfamily II)
MDPGHAFEAQAFKETGTIVYHQQQERSRTERTSSYSDYFTPLGPGVNAALRGLELVEPDIVFDDRWTVDPRGAKLVLYNWGPGHTADDQTVQVDRSVLFARGLLQKGAFPIVPYFAPFDSHFASSRWIAVPARGPMATVADASDVRDYLVWIRAEVSRLNNRERWTEEAHALVQQRDRERWHIWQSDQWITHLITACLAERTFQ